MHGNYLKNNANNEPKEISTNVASAGQSEYSSIQSSESGISLSQLLGRATTMQSRISSSREPGGPPGGDQGGPAGGDGAGRQTATRKGRRTVTREGQRTARRVSRRTATRVGLCAAGLPNMCVGGGGRPVPQSAGSGTGGGGMTNRSTSSSSLSSSSSIGLVGPAGSTSKDDKRGAEDWRETQEGTMEANRGSAWGRVGAGRPGGARSRRGATRIRGR